MLMIFQGFLRVTEGAICIPVCYALKNILWSVPGLVSCTGADATFLPVFVLQHLVLSLSHAAAEPVCALPFRRSKCDSDPRPCVLVQHRH